MGKLRNSLPKKSTSALAIDFICDFCGQIERGRGYLQRHFDKKHRKFYCNVCDQVYSQKANLLEHLRSHFERFICQYCGLEIYRFEQFQKHVYQKHEPDNKQLILSIQSKENYQCRFCVRTFPNPIHRNCHENNVHKGRSEAAFKCVDCNLTFITKEDLRSHSFEHYTGTLNFCAYPNCDRFFKTAKQLRNHTNIHGPSKYECEKCQQRFFQSSNFSKHKKRCKGEPKKLNNKFFTKNEQEENSRTAKEQFLSLGGKLKNVQKDKQTAAKKPKKQKEKIEEEISLLSSGIIVEYLEEFSDEVRITLDEILPLNTTKTLKRSRKVLADEANATIEDEPVVKRSKVLNRSRVHLSNPRFICDVCAFQTFTQAALRDHLKKQHAEKSLTCCSETFNKKTELNRHQRIVHKVSWKRKKLLLTFNATCDYCGLLFETMNDLRKHMKRHMNMKKNCNLCHKKLYNVKKHIREVHEVERFFVCPVCEAGFKSQSNLKNHIKTHEEPSDCPICHKLLPNMERHLHWHKQPKSKPHQCQQCNKFCSTKQAMQEHIHRIHEKMPLGKTYSCSICNLDFIRNHDLRLHSYIHYQGRIFTCDFPGCNEMFKTSFKLHCHTMVHNPTNEASFKCNFCDRKYLRKASLHKHQRQLHSDLTKTLSIKIIKKEIGNELE